MKFTLALATATVIFTNITMLEAKELNIGEFLQSPSDNIIKLIVGASGETLAWVNTRNESQGEKPLYCAPQKLAVTNDQYVSILLRHLEKNPLLQDVSWSTYPLLLADALAETFPCPWHKHKR